MNHHSSHRTMQILLALCLASIALGLSLFVSLPAPVWADVLPPVVKTNVSLPLPNSTYIVTNTNDSGVGSLRDAITQARASAGADTINITATGVIVLSTWLPNITDTLTIHGPGASLLTISGNNTVNVMSVVGGGTLHLSDVTIANGGNTNYGGGIYNEGTLLITNTTFYSNAASFDGGGIMNGGGKLIVTNSTLYSNTAGYGGGIYNNGPLTVTNSTFYSNTSSVSAGGGIYNQLGNTAIISNSTFYSNTATTAGGGIHNEGTLTVTNGTIANNTAPLYGNCYGSTGITNGGNNIDSGTTCGWDSTSGSMSNTDPLLGPLVNNGEPTLTMALLPGSPAIDAANDALCSSTDQRGAHRPIGPHCDIGAYEAGYLFLPLVLK